MAAEEEFITYEEARGILGVSKGEFQRVENTDLWPLFRFMSGKFLKSEILAYKKKLDVRRRVAEPPPVEPGSFETGLFPDAMFRAHRALCSNCGAPRPLEGAEAAMSCGYCGNASVVERRLRTMEPKIKGAESAEEWVASVLAQLEHARCPGCGGSLDLDPGRSVVQCKSCGSHAKIERRTRRSAPPPATGEESEDTDSLIRRLLSETDLAERVTIAQQLNGWSHANATAARRLPELMETLRTCDPILGHALAELICKLLCQEEKTLWTHVVWAAEKVVSDVRGSRALLFQLGMGSGVCLKVLLDAAESAAKRGAIDYACTALWGAGQIFQRHYEEHPAMYEILLYRMIYLSGPALGWALRMAKGRMGVAYRYPTPTLLRFIDDCVLERPELVPELFEALYEGPAKNEGEYRSRLELFRSLRTPEARAAALQVLCAPPAGLSLRLLGSAVEKLISLLDDPRLSAPACVALSEILDAGRGVPQEIHALVKARRDALPEDLRRAYLKHVPKSPHLAPLAARSWEPESPELRDDELVEADLLWEEGLKRAVAVYERERESLKTFWARIKDRTALQVAATKGDAPGVRALLERGTPVDERDPNGQTALMWAAESGHADLVRELLARGAARDLRDKDGNSAFVLAAANDHGDVVRSLLDSAAIDPSQLQEAFRAVLTRRRLGLMKLLLERGADPDTVEADGRTPLMLAARRGDEELARVLLSSGARFDHQDAEGKTALMHAAEAGATGLVRMLLAAGADPTLPCPNGDTARILATRAGHVEIADLLHA